MQPQTNSTFNINDQVEVVLTDKGHQVLMNDYIGQRMAEYDLEGKTLTVALWELMQVFGDDIYMGGPQLFENNELTFKQT